VRSVEVAWAAGLFEGEGCIHADRKLGRIRLRFTVTSTDLDVLERFEQAVGCGSISGPYWQPKSTKPTYSWKARKPDDVRHLSALLRPYLGQRRLARLEELESEQRSQRPIVGRRHYLTEGQTRLA
jgi:hypothetical protein